jgi:hypothetical protein
MALNASFRALLTVSAAIIAQIAALTASDLRAQHRPRADPFE